MICFATGEMNGLEKVIDFYRFCYFSIGNSVTRRHEGGRESPFLVSHVVIKLSPKKTITGRNHYRTAISFLKTQNKWLSGLPALLGKQKRRVKLMNRLFYLYK